MNNSEGGISLEAINNEATNEVEKYLSFINQQISELEKFLDFLSNIKTNKEKSILTYLGKGVYLPASLADGKFFVDAGAGVIVRKTLDEAMEIVSFQLKSLKESRIQISSDLGRINK